MQNDQVKAFTLTGTRWLLALAVVFTATACSSVNNYVPTFLQPYRAEVQQGNWLTQSQVNQLEKGMTREQVRFVLGSPMLTSIFHADRWDYPFLFKPSKGQTEQRLFTVHFANGQLDHWEGDEQPTIQPFQQAPRQ